MKRASNDTLAGRRYLDLQREAKRTGRPTDELIQLYALECFLDRLIHSKFADNFILKGGIKDKNPNLDPQIKPVKLSAKERTDLLAFIKALEPAPTPFERPKLPE